MNELFNMMFDNVGGKIKTLSKVVYVVGIIMAVLSMVAWFGIAEEASWRYEDTFETVAWVSLITGIFSSWAISLLINGFGELIEKNTEIAKNTKSVRPIVTNNATAGKIYTGMESDINTLRDIEANLPSM